MSTATHSKSNSATINARQKPVNTRRLDNDGRYVCGIDFGTSNSSVAVWDRREGRLLENRGKDVLIRPEPTLLYFPQTRTVGRRLDEHYLGAAAIERYIADNMDGRLLQALKTIFPDRLFTETRINGIDYTLPDLAALVIRHLRQKAEQAAGERIDRVVLGRPAVFHEDLACDQLAEDRLREAARLAGFREVYFQLEPIAAAYDYEQRLTRPEVVLVGDFGGGTSDFTIMRLDPGALDTRRRESAILATGGVSVAGNKMDAAVMWSRLTPLFGRGATYREFQGGPELRAPSWVHHQICRWDQLPFLAADLKLMELLRKMENRSNNSEGFRQLQLLIHHNEGYALFRSIEAAKIALSARDQSRLRFHSRHGGIEIETEVLYPDFVDWVADQVEAIGNCLDAVVKTAGVAPQAIDSVYLTGGSSHLRPVRQLFLDRFPADRIHHGEAFTSVAAGLARSARLLEG